MKKMSLHRFTEIALIAVILLCFGVMFYPFKTSLLLAALFAFALEPIVSKYTHRKVKRDISTAAIIFALFVMISGPIVFVGYRVVSKVIEFSKQGFQNTAFFASLNHFASSTTEFAVRWGDRLGLSSGSLPDTGAIISNAGTFVLNGATAFASNLPDFFMNLFVFTAALYFFLTESREIKKSILKLDMLPAREVNQFIQVLQRSSYISTVSTLIIGALQAFIVSVAAYFCGYTEFIIVFVITFFVSLIPVVGAAPVALVLSMLSFMTSDYVPAIVLLVTAVVAGSIDNIIKPIIVNGADDDLHPVMSLLAVIGAVLVYGMPGLILGPVLTQLTFKIIPILFQETES